MRSKIIAVLILLGALGAAFHLAGRTQGEAWEKAFAARLADDAIAPDEAVKAALAFRSGAAGAISPASAGSAGGAGGAVGVAAGPAAPPPPEDRLEGRARLRYLLATGYTMRELGPGPAPASDDASAAADAIQAGSDRERRATEAVAALCAAHLDIPMRFLVEAKDPAVRRRAAQSLGLVSSPAAIAALRALFGDPDEGVRTSAFVSATTVARRTGDPAALAKVLEEGAVHRTLATRAFQSARAVGGPQMVPVYLTILERHDAEIGDADRKAAREAILEAVGPERAKTAPETADAAAWRAWWNSSEEKK